MSDWVVGLTGGVASGKSTVERAFQALARIGIGEHAAAHRRAIQAAIAGEHARAEHVDHVGQTLAADGHRIARGLVGIGDDDAQRLEMATDLALARGHAAGQADDEFAHAWIMAAALPL